MITLDTTETDPPRRFKVPKGSQRIAWIVSGSAESCEPDFEFCL